MKTTENHMTVAYTQALSKDSVSFHALKIKGQGKV